MSNYFLRDKFVNPFRFSKLKFRFCAIRGWKWSVCYRMGGV